MIPIHNIYYMLSYAFSVLNEQGYKSITTEEFHNVGELCAAILAKGVSKQIKRGLGREYITECEELSSPREKIEITETIKAQSLVRKKLVCTFDEYSHNFYMNRIIKTTICLLLKSRISSSRKKDLRKVLVFFEGVEELDYHLINWNIQYNRNNQTYRMLISICFLIIKGLIQNQSDGSVKLMDFLDERRMSKLYELFILEYYRKEHPKLSANATQIPWKLDDDYDDMLPVMQTDISLTYMSRNLIIDAKYYGKSVQEQYGIYKNHSGNLYQIFTYVKNKEFQLVDSDHEPVSGMILYAKTDEEVFPNNLYRMSGNLIEVRTLDLSGEFSSIRDQLDGIADRFLYKSK